MKTNIDWRKVMRKSLLAIVIASVAFLSVGLTACSKSDVNSLNSNNQKTSGTVRTLDDIKKSGTLKVGVFSDKAPFGYVDKDGKNQGYDIYFAQRLAKDLGVKIEFTITDPASRVEFVDSGKVDIILANFTKTPERVEKVDFALPYMQVALGVVSSEKAPVKTLADLSGKTLIVAKGTTAETYFTKNHPEVKLLKFDQYAEAYSALLDGRGDALSTDNTEVLAWAISNPDFVVEQGVSKIGDVDVVAPAVKKGNTTVLDWINKEIANLPHDFFLEDYKATLEPVYGNKSDPNNIIIENGKF
ncbi:MAG: transporter substrate-binding domain-containing protein [Candidatus Ancillula sp.]|jgi:polar amino acid transport system substrate-binding protein|nr:transporter substrate-binding domain-containing protein [Candidatus Ancillula sp.]